MKKLSIIPFILMSLVALPGWDVNVNDLVQRDGIYYKKFSDVPFTGEVDELSASGYFWLKGKLENGERVGVWFLYYTTNGQLAVRGNHKNGKRDGRWVYYDSEGNRDMEVSGVYKNGLKISD